MPRSQEQYDKIRKEKKQLISDSALELFAENGYHATSMNRIAQKAGVSKGLAYNYFQSKQEILDEIVQTGFDSIYAHFDLNHDGVLTRDEFEHFIRQSFRIISNNRRFWKLYTALMMQSDLAGSFQKKYGEQTKSIMLMLQKFISSMGSNDPEGDLIAISALLKGAIMLVIASDNLFSTQYLENKITKACFRLITTK